MSNTKLSPSLCTHASTYIVVEFPVIYIWQLHLRPAVVELGTNQRGAQMNQS
jgi:hypothetical protein